MLQTAYEDNAMGKSQVYDWFWRFKKGEILIYDQPRSEHPLTSRTDKNVEKFRAIVLEDRQDIINEMYRELSE